MPCAKIDELFDRGWSLSDRREQLHDADRQKDLEVEKLKETDRRVRAHEAALVPADPSGRDRSVAAEAAATEARARQEMMKQKSETSNTPIDPRAAKYEGPKKGVLPLNLHA